MIFKKDDFSPICYLDNSDINITKDSKKSVLKLSSNMLNIDTNSKCNTDCENCLGDILSNLDFSQSEKIELNNPMNCQDYNFNILDLLDTYNIYENEQLIKEYNKNILSDCKILDIDKRKANHIINNISINYIYENCLLYDRNNSPFKDKIILDEILTPISIFDPPKIKFIYQNKKYLLFKCYPLNYCSFYFIYYLEEINNQPVSNIYIPIVYNSILDTYLLKDKNIIKNIDKYSVIPDMQILIRMNTSIENKTDENIMNIKKYLDNIFN